MRIVVISSTPDQGLAGFLDAFDHTGIVTVGNELSPTLVKRVTAICGGPSPTSGASVQLDIHLGGSQFGHWQMRRSGRGECEASGMLQIDAELMDMVIYYSKQIDHRIATRDPAWREELDHISTQLRMLLFRNSNSNIECWSTFLKHREQVGGVSRSRIRVTVNDETHPVLLEALRDGADPLQQSWVLNAPVFRRYATQVAYPPLFKDAASRAGPINCLVIEADGAKGSAEIGGANWDFEPLGLLNDEAVAVKGIFKRNTKGAVDHLRLSEYDGDLSEAVVTALRERQWHIVHFCGHVHGEGSDAALILRAAPGGVLPIKKVSTALNKTQLLFLNSCRSGATRVVMHAVDQSVAALLGFQWMIEDKAALDFALDFYQALFDGSDEQSRYLEHALLQARKHAYTRHPEEPAWLAPVLVMQMG